MHPEPAVFAAMLERNGVKPRDVLEEHGISSWKDDRVMRALSVACFPYFGPPASDGSRSPSSGSDFHDDD